MSKSNYWERRLYGKNTGGKSGRVARKKASRWLHNQNVSDYRHKFCPKCGKPTLMINGKHHEHGLDEIGCHPRHKCNL